jgi:hypothetical protein
MTSQRTGRSRLSAGLAAAALVSISTAGAPSSASTTPERAGSSRAANSLAPRCGTISIGRSKFLVELIDGRTSCASARFVLQHARFQEKSGIRGWSCWRGTPARGFTSVVDACDRSPRSEIQAVPVKDLSRIGKACRRFAGPGDTGIHSADFRVHGVSCQTGKEVVEICRADGTTCNAGTSAWYCKKLHQRPALGYAERCTSGSSFTSIVWLD